MLERPEWAALYEDGGRCLGVDAEFLAVAAACRRCPMRVQVERPQPRSGEDERPGRARARRQDVRPRRKTPGYGVVRRGGERPGGWGAGLISLSPPGRRIRPGRRGFAPVAHLRDGPSMRPERWLWRLPERRACWW